MTGEIEVAVMGQIHRRRLVGDGRVVERQLVGVVDGDDHAYRERARIPLVAGHARVREHRTLYAPVLERSHVPRNLMKASAPPMQVVVPVVDRDGMRVPVEYEPTACNAVSVAPDQ